MGLLHKPPGWRGICLTILVGLSFCFCFVVLPVAATNSQPPQIVVVFAVKLSDKGLGFIKLKEGFRSKPYREGANEWTIGYGHYIQPGEVYTSLTREEAHLLMLQDITPMEEAINRLVIVPLTQNQFDALVSFMYNVGISQFKTSTLLKKLNLGDYEGAAQELPRWDKVQGKQNAGLHSRRLAEMHLFTGGYYATYH